MAVPAARMLLTVDEALELTGNAIGRNKAYQMIKEDNEFLGVPIVRIGRKIKIPRRKLEETLGLDQQISTSPSIEPTPPSVDDALLWVGHDHQSETLPTWLGRIQARKLDEVLAEWRTPTNYSSAARDGWVYFLQGEVTGVIKIGVSTFDVEGRINDVRAMSPDYLRVLRVLPGGHSFEAWLHNCFQDSRQHGEWFKPHRDLLKLIDSTLDLDARIPLGDRKSIPMFT